MQVGSDHGFQLSNDLAIQTWSIAILSRGNEKLSNKQHERATLLLRLRLRLPVLVLVPSYKRCEDAGGGKGGAHDERGMETCQERVLQIADAAGGKALPL